MSQQTVTVQTPDGPMDIYMVFPEKSSSVKTHPAVIVLQEAFGVNSHIKSICQRLAAEGYVAAAPELFHRGGKGLQIAYTEFAKKGLSLMGQLSNDRLADDIAATLDYLKTVTEVDQKKVSAFGFCFGGFAAVLAACRLPMAAVISFYGGGINKLRPGIGLSPLLSEFKQIQCPVLLIYAEKDHSISAADVEMTKKALSSAKKKFDLHVYPGVDHGFFCDERASYNPDAARSSWAEALSWLSSNI